jgi:hypothetical protein
MPQLFGVCVDCAHEKARTTSERCQPCAQYRRHTTRNAARPHTSLTQRNAEIAEKYRNGATLRELADEYGVTFQAVQYVLMKLGVNRRYRRALTEAQVQAAYATANDLHEFGKKLGVKPATARSILKSFNLVPLPTPYQAQHEARDAHLANLYTRYGLTTAATLGGASRWLVRRAAERTGTPRHPADKPRARAR